jgi:putative ABC transport system permease protein|tara:strand:+ start:85 stop:663 length:579 start_codon:yes stop_codon:yes gene_type:complete
MFIQLIAIGYCLKYIFNNDHPAVIMMILGVMILIAGYIAPRPLEKKQFFHYLFSTFSIFIAGSGTLYIVTQFVIKINPWYNPHFLIPLGGMIFANCMNSISLAAERFENENGNGLTFEEQRNISFKASLIPITNSLLAVGLVSLPGTMTGMILSGISPLIAVKYQIMVMCMIFGSTGISSALYLVLMKKYKE